MVATIPESKRQIYQDAVLGLCFSAIAAAAARRVLAARHGSGGAGENVIGTLYSLIMFTAVARAVWLLIPSRVLEPSYAPQPVYAFRGVLHHLSNTIFELFLATSVGNCYRIAVVRLEHAAVSNPTDYPILFLYALFPGQWLGTLASELLLTIGTVQLFAIFILFAIYWSNLVKKVSLQPSIVAIFILFAIYWSNLVKKVSLQPSIVEQCA
jgi:hypothetical protein